MKYLFYFISFIFPALCSSAQPAERDSSIYIASSRLYRMGESLVVSMQVDITRQIPSNESVILVPRLSDSLDNFIQLPAIYVNGRKQHIFFQRETGRQEKDYEELRRRNDRKQSVHYLRSIPFTHWMKHASLHFIEKECGCGVPRHTDSTYLTRLNILPDIHPHVASSLRRWKKGKCAKKADVPIWTSRSTKQPSIPNTETIRPNWQR